MSCCADGSLGRPTFSPARLRHRLSPACGLARVRAGFVERGREGVAVPPFRVGGGGTPFRRLRFPSVVAGSPALPKLRRPRACRRGWVTVPACSTKRMGTVPPVASMPPGRRPAGVTTGGSPFARSLEPVAVRGLICKTVGNGDGGVAPRFGIHALGQGPDECSTGLVDGLQVVIVAGLPDGLFQRLVEGIHRSGFADQRRHP